MAELSALSVVAAVTLSGVAMTGAGVPGLGGTARAAYLGSEGRIAFVRGGDIYSIRPSGSGMRLLASGGHDAGPRWSPDGTRLAYLDNGNLWIMNANGSHKHQITRGAPGHTDGRPTWSPSGRYLAFVRTARHAKHGYVTRYDTVTGHFATFTATIASTLTKVPSLPGTAVAWQRAMTGDQFGYFLLYEGAGIACPPAWYCLDELGFPVEAKFANVFPSVEDSHAAPIRDTDPDWFPIDPQFDNDVVISVESCTASLCTHQGIRLQITSPLVLAGAYEAVYSPSGQHIAFVRSGRHGARIYTKGLNPAIPEPTKLLTAGTEPDWQPVAPFPPA